MSSEACCFVEPDGRGVSVARDPIARRLPTAIDRELPIRSERIPMTTIDDSRPKRLP